MDTQAYSKDELAKFEKIKTELQKTSNIFPFLATLKGDDLKTWTLEQWNIILGLVDTALKSGIPDLILHNDFIKFVEKLELVVTQSSFTIYCTILLFILEVVVRLLSELQSSQSTAHQNDTKILISLMVKLLTAFKISSMKSLNDEQFTLLIKVIKRLYNIVELKPSFIEIITILEVWKSFSNFVAVYIKRAQAPHNMDKLKQVLEKPVAYLLREVGSNIEFVKNAEALQRPISQLDKYLRVTNFYLKILRGILTGMKHKEFVAVNEFFQSYKKSKLLPLHLIGTEIANLLEKYVQKDFDVLLGLVCQHPDMLKNLLALTEGETSKQQIILLDAYLCTIISKGDRRFIVTNRLILIEMFELCFKDSKAFLNPKTCDDIVVKFAALILLDETLKLFRYFRKNIFKENFWIAAASTEVLILLQRYQNKHLKHFDAILLEELKYWLNCNSAFAVFSNNLLQTHIVRLLENSAQLYGSSSKKQLLKTSNIKQLSPEDYRNYLIIGVHNSNDTKNELNHLLNDLSAGNGTVESYYKSVFCMQLLTSFHSTPDKEIIDNVAIMIRKFLNFETSKRNPFSLFISVGLKLLAKFIDTAQPYDAEQLSSCLNMISNVAAFPGSINLLHSYTKSSSQQLKQQAISALKENKIVPFSGSSCTTLTDIIEFIDNEKHSHTCFNDNSPEGPQVKRKCFATTIGKKNN